jgi:Rrf2 family protein
MLFTRAERYGLRCIIHLASQPGGGLSTLEDLSVEQGISRQYLANIMCHLTAAGLAHTYRGAHGGYTLARPADQITVADIWDAIRSADAPINCVIHDAECPRQTNCPIRHLFEDAFNQLHAYLGRWTIQQLAAELTQMHMPMACGPERASG